MANTSQKVVLTVDVQGEIGNFQQKISQMQQSLQKLSLPKALDAKSKSALEDLEKRVENVQSLTADNKVKLVDEKTVKNELDSISREFMALVTKLNKEGANIKLGDRKSYDAVNKAIDDYNKGISDAKTKVDKQAKAVEDLKNNYKALQKLALDSKDNTAEKQADLKAAQAARKKAQEKSDIYFTRRVAAGDSEAEAQKKLEGTKTYQNEQAAIELVKTKTQELADAQAKEQAAQQELDSASKTYVSDLAKAQQQLDKYKAALDNISAANLKAVLKELSSAQTSGKIKLDFDPNSITSVDELKTKLKDINEEDMSKVAEALSDITKVGKEGATSADELSEGLEKDGEAAKEFDSELKHIKDRVKQFFALNNAVQLFQRAVKSAFSTIKELDSVMTEAAVVTDFSVGDMWDQLPEYTQRANDLGVSIKDAYESMTIFYQQGLNTNQAVALSNETLKMARIAGLDAAEATDRMTNALRGFNMELNETNAERVDDVYNKLAAMSASNVDEISTAMTKVASLASSANMSFESTSAFLAQMIETTRESAETAGTALKTVIARFSEVKSLYSNDELTGTDSEGEVIDVNKVSTALRTAGIDLNKYFVGEVGLDDIFMELAEKWDSLDQVQQRYIATQAAGSRQQSRFIAMMSDYKRTVELTTAAENSGGAANEMFAKTQESLESKLNRLENAWNTFLMSITNSTVVKTFIDLLTDLMTVVNNLTNALSGGNGIVKSLETVFLTFGAFKGGKTLFSGLGKDFITDFATSFKKGDTISVLKGAGTSIAQNFKDAFNKALTKGKDTINTVKDIFYQKYSTYSLEEMGIGANDKVDLSKVDFNGFNGINNVINGTKKEQFQKLLKSQLYKGYGLTEEQIKNGETPFVDTEIDGFKTKTNYQGYTVSNLIDEGKFTEAQEKAKAYGLQLDVTGKQAEYYGLRMKDVQKDLEAMGTACSVAGMAVLGLTSIISDSTAEGRIAKNILTTLGVALTAMPVILKVVSAAFTKFGLSVETTFLGLPVVGWISALITALVTLGAALISWIDENSYSKKIEKIEQATEDAKTAAEGAKTAYDNLLTTQTDYDELQDTLEDLTRGTLEWKEALIEANQKVLDLIDSYPELVNYISKGTEGQLIITDDGWDELIEKEEAAVRSTQMATVSDTLTELELERNNVKDVHLGGYTPGGDVKDFFQTRLNKFYDIYQRDPEQFAKNANTGEYGVAVMDLASKYGMAGNALDDFIDDLNDYTSDLVDLDNQIIAEISTLFSSNDTAVSKSDYASQIEKAYGLALTNDNSKYSKDKKNYTDILGDAGQNANYNNDEFLDIAERYNVRSQITSSNGEDNLKILYKAMAGLGADDTSVDEMTAESLVENITQMLTNEELTADADAMANSIAKMSDQTMQKQFAAAIADDFGSLTVEELNSFDLNSLMAAYTDEGGGDITTLAAQSGASSALAYVQGIRSQFEQEKGDLLSTYEDLLNSAAIEEDSYVGKSLTSISTGTLQNLRDQITTFAPQQAQDYIEAFNDVLDSAPSDQTALANYLSTVDVSDMSSLIDAMDYVDSLFDGMVDIDKMENYWKAAVAGADTYVATLEDALSVMNKLTNKIEDATTITDALAEGSATNEQLETLVKAGYDISNLTYTKEGWKADEEDIPGIQELLSGVAAQEATLVYDTQKDAIDQAREYQANHETTSNDVTGLNGNIDAITTAQEANYVANQISDATGISVLMKGINESDELYISRIKEIYQNYLNDLGSVEEVSIASLNGDTSQITSSNATAIADQLVAAGVLDSASNEGMDESEYLEMVKESYEDYYKLVGEEGDVMLTAIDKQRAFIEGAQYGTTDNASENSVTDEGMDAAMQTEAEYYGLEAEDVQDYADKLKSYTTELTNANNKQVEVQRMSNQMADRIAIDNARLDKGVATLNDNYEDWEATLKSTAKDSSDYSDALKGVKEAMRDVLGMTGDLSDDFYTNEENLALMEKAADGDSDAIQQLRVNAGKQMLIDLGVDTSGLAEADAAIDEITSKDYEIGIQANMDDTAVLEGLYDTLEAAGATTDEIQDFFDSIGWEPQIEQASYTVSARDVSAGYIQVPHYRTLANGQVVGGTTVQKIGSDIKAGDTVTYPVIGSKKHNYTYRGKPSATVQSTAPSSTSSGSSGGSEDKSDQWLNPYDELYNLTEKINENLRQREAIQRRYNRLLKDTNASASDVVKTSLQEIANLRQQYAMQKQMLAGRKRQIENIGNEQYQDDDGNITTYSKTGAQKYVWYDWNLKSVQIDWDALEKVRDTALGDAIDSYKSRLEELVGEYEDTEDTLDEIQDSITEIEEQGKDTYKELEQRIYDALVQQRQDTIDSFQDLSDSIDDANSSIINDLKDSIDLQRQIRDNTETKQDIADKEQRLAYLQMDTSGGNQTEILKLQKEIEEARQDYEDTLIDQTIDQLSDDNDKASEQRQKQIELLQAQLDYEEESGAFWGEVKELLGTSGISDTLNKSSKLVQLLEQIDNVAGMSEVGQLDWIDEFVKTANESAVGILNWGTEIAKNQANGVSINNGADTVTYNSTTGNWVGKSGVTYTDFSAKYDTAGGWSYTGTATASSYLANQNLQSGAKGAAVTALQRALYGLGYLTSADSITGTFDKATISAVKALQKDAGLSQTGIAGKGVATYLKGKGYATGGLADYTGPAWLDGTKSKPELVLSATDTENFIALKDILAQFMDSSSSESSSTSGGDNYFDISISADISSDYDVDQLATKIKKQIADDASYRNVNTISWIR